MSSETAAAPSETEAARENLLKRNSDDVGWEYGVLVDANNKDKVKCKFCDNEMRGGIYRLKEHLAHVGKNVKKCTSTTPQALEAKEKCKKAIEAAKRKREEKTVRELELREEVNVSRVGEESEEVTCVGSSQPHKLGPIDKWTRAIDPWSVIGEAVGAEEQLEPCRSARVRELYEGEEFESEEEEFDKDEDDTWD
ncbi:hypothetical protein PVAP13_2KG169716 [Panicum virgatum]|uniref:BED-type domain-containing protein n=1 Tax=Panicum virgatum TaxID=38727 RepID=A0A8T0VYJ5_PANVG|nr:hypothetical protein PVAP13_2KG169716 [Panicum virgatum]